MSVTMRYAVIRIHIVWNIPNTVMNRADAGIDEEESV